MTPRATLSSTGQYVSPSAPPTAVWDPFSRVAKSGTRVSWPSVQMASSSRKFACPCRARLSGTSSCTSSWTVAPRSSSTRRCLNGCASSTTRSSGSQLTRKMLVCGSDTLPWPNPPVAGGGQRLGLRSSVGAGRGRGGGRTWPPRGPGRPRARRRRGAGGAGCGPARCGARRSPGRPPGPGLPGTRLPPEAWRRPLAVTFGTSRP